MNFRAISDQLSKGIPPQKRRQRLTVDECAVIADMMVSTSGLMIDVGAHHGASLRHFLDKGWTVHAFEPCSVTRKVLKSRIDEHERERCRLDSRAISDKQAKDVRIFTSKQSSGITSLIPFHSTHTEGELVDVITLDRYLAEQSLKDINFLKIDTEGNDLPVLKGLGLGKHAPEVVLCEFEDGKTSNLGYDWKDLANYLTQNSYQVWVSEWHPIVEYGRRHEWCALKPYPCELEDPSAWGNFLAFKSTVDEELLVRRFSERVSKLGIKARLRDARQRKFNWLKKLGNKG